MADPLISALSEKLAEAAIVEVKQQVGLVMGVKREVGKLGHNLKAIQAVLLDAEKRQVHEASVKRWFDRLKDVSYDMDDVLDEWNTIILKSKIDDEEKEGERTNDINERKKVCFFVPSSLFCCIRVPRLRLRVRRDIALKIKDLNEKLNDIAIEKERYSFRTTTSSNEQLERPKTTSLVDVSEVYGRGNEKSILISKLCESNHESGAPVVIPIVGMGGIGKTTFAQVVYNDENVKTHFEPRIWVCVSDPFDESKIAKAIVEALEGKSPNVSELETLLQRIYESVSEKRFLLVLDDVWTEDDRKWEQIKKHLRSGAVGSKILVTTRKREVAIMMGAETQMINLTLLSESDCWSIFSQIAFLNRDRNEELEKIGKQIARKCKGLPLVAKTLGSLMRFKKNIKEEWEDVLNSKLWELDDIQLKVFVPFLLSYYDLPSIEKRCFSICSIFPKDYVINVDDLIDLWISQGYVTVPKSNLKKKGEYHFENLAMRSFFQDFQKDPYGNISKCKMHDIIHDFAQFLTKNECFVMEVRGDESTGKMEEANVKIRHSMLVVESDNYGRAQIPISMYNQKYLRTLYVTCPHIISLPILRVDSLSNLTCLRSLSVSHCAVSEIPKDIDRLIHLRYLNFSDNPGIREVPDALCNLYNLQTLKMTECQIKKLPEGMGRLVNLRHLYIWSPIVTLSGLAKGVGRLTSLETLDQFVVPDPEDDRGAFMKFEALNELKHLRGSISIANCGRLDIVEAGRAQLKDKEHIVELELSFTQSRSNENRSNVLEALAPHPNLKYLNISHYHGTTVSHNWLTSLTNLRHLRLFMCPCFESLPPLGKLPSLESLQMEWMQRVRKVGLEFLGIERNNEPSNTVSSSNSSFVSFPKLKRLHIFRLYEWREWENIGSSLRGEEQDRHLRIMPCLSFLEIIECYLLDEIPDFLRNRPNLTIKMWPEEHDRLFLKQIMGLFQPRIQP
ncbi:NB-ARC domain, LRR domain containing protein [Trema orientale]|uniref:NB-ARC domain, LRR domain containing protein n=1 Tax=Trema orientale TaxID=63057 RepID=A0A2P5F429_TREOI|nr:NB-ARC domain, LRR domain containing protein [Trema orientale]